MALRFKPAAIVLLLLVARLVSAQTNRPPLSDRIVHYVIDARLDPATHTILGNETLTYKNVSGQPLDTFPFHLYLNGFRPDATWVQEIGRAGNEFRIQAVDWKEADYGASVIQRFAVSGMGDLTTDLHFIAPDDGNASDKTVVEIKLPRPVPAGETVQFEIQFQAKLPKIVARTGYMRDYVLAGQWFPKIGVWWDGKWNCHQFHAFTEFFADFGTYDVRVTVPRNYVFGATGAAVQTVDNPDGTRTYWQHADDVHDFAWTADPHFLEVEKKWFSLTGDRVDIRFLVHPEHADQVDRHIDVARKTLALFEKWYGPYPYSTLTIVDPAHGALESGGMEYPTFITAGTHILEPRGLRITEEAVEHEFGHQYWYGMVGSNETEDAWLDEGINSYSQAKAMQAMFGKGTSFIQIFGVTGDDADLLRREFRNVGDWDPLARNGWEFHDFNSYGGTTYGKTASMLLTLESVIGEDTMQRALRLYFERYRFQHPHEEDFIKTVEEVSGRDLHWFFDQAVYGTAVLDYEVSEIDSENAAWPSAKESGMTRSFVTVHRKGDFTSPVTLEVRFDNGEVVREAWDGKDRWHRFEYTKTAKVVSAAVDPDRTIALDRDYLNNGKTVQARPRAAWKLANLWMFLIGFFEQLAGGLA